MVGFLANIATKRLTLRRRFLAAMLGVTMAGNFALPAAAHMPPGAGPQFNTLAPIVQQATPAVVSIAVRARVKEENPLFRDPFYQRFFDLPQRFEREVMAAGSGVIVDAMRGYVLTNNHVVEHATAIEVTTRDNQRLQATLVGRDPANDIAVLRLHGGTALTALPWGDSDRLQVGDFVIAIGNPFGIGQTVTGGMVSAVGRTVRNGNGRFIQTDASINPGNSGGALVDMEGRLVGINSAILSAGGGNIGIGFAVPTNVARRAMEQIIRHGTVRRGLLGIAVEDLTPVIAEALHTTRQQGVVVAAVAPDSPAARAGIRTEDIVLAVDGEHVTSAAQLQEWIGLAVVGQTVRLTLERDGVTRVVAVRVAAQNTSRAN